MSRCRLGSLQCRPCLPHQLKWVRTCGPDRKAGGELRRERRTWKDEARLQQVEDIVDYSDGAADIIEVKSEREIVAVHSRYGRCWQRYQTRSLDEVGSEDAGLAKLDDPTRRESYASILARAQQNSIVAAAEASQPLELMHWSMHSHSAVFCEIAVNRVTAEPRIRRILGSFDCGRILNPKTARSQFRGGIIMGLGMALMEETQFDERNGRIMNPNLSDYHIPVHLDVPDIDVIWTDIPDPRTPMGAHGIGEIGITGVAAAVANAIYNATGKRVRDLPITLEKLL